MKLNKLLSLSFFSLMISSHLFSASWVDTQNVPNENKAFSPVFIQVMVDNQGNETAVWEEGDTLQNGRLSAARLKAGSNKWTLTNSFSNYPKEQIGLPHSSGAFPESISAISKEGIIASIWKTSENSVVFNFKSSLLQIGSLKWDKPLSIGEITTNIDKEFNAIGIALTFDKNSRLHSVWSDTKEGLANIKASYLDSGASKWSTPVILSSGTLQKLDNALPKVANNPLQDRIVAVWIVQKDASHSYLYGAYLLAETNQWSAPVLLSSEFVAISYNSYQVSQVTVENNKNHAVVAWIEDTIIDFKPKFAILDSSNEWLINQSIPQVSQSSFTSLAIDQDLTATIVFNGQKVNSPINRIFAAQISANGKVSSPITITSNDTALKPLVVVDPAGKSTAIWNQKISDSVAAIFSAERVKNGKWTSPLQISSETSTETATPYFDLAINLAGTVSAVWIDNNIATNANGMIKAAIKKGNLPLPPLCIKASGGKETFLLQKVYTTTITWCKSPSTTVAKYNVYRNGKLIGSVAADQLLTLTDSSQTNDSGAIYSVKAVTKTGLSSLPVYVSLQ